MTQKYGSMTSGRLWGTFKGKPKKVEKNKVDIKDIIKKKTVKPV